MTVLSGWANFYVIVGSSAGALIGLQFVAMTLIANYPIGRGVAQAGSAFATPGVVHFAVVLLLSAINSAPWDDITLDALLWGIVGIGGLLYTLVVARRLRTQTVYKPVFEDWLFHVLLPFAAYITLAVSTIVALSDARLALYIVAAAALLLLFLDIHNAWDAVTYQVYVNQQRQRDAKRD